MLRAAVAARTIVDLAGIRLGRGDQVGRGLVGGVVVHHEAPFDRRDQRYWLEVLEDVPRHCGVEIGQHGHDAVVEPADGVAVRRCLGDPLGADQARRPGLILDNDRLPHALRHALRNDPRSIVDGTRRRERDNHLDRLVRIR